MSDINAVQLCALAYLCLFYSEHGRKTLTQIHSMCKGVRRDVKGLKNVMRVGWGRTESSAANKKNCLLSSVEVIGFELASAIGLRL